MYRVETEDLKNLDSNSFLSFSGYFLNYARHIWKNIFAPGLQKTRGCVYKKKLIPNFIYTHKKTGCK